jgi:GT2 family glycosyltransferase
VDAKNMSTMDHGRLTYIQSNENGGYAKGNNIGLRWAEENGFNYGFIINPDVEVMDYKVIQNIINIMKNDEFIAAVGPEIINTLGEGQLPPRRLTKQIWFNLFYPFSGIASRIWHAWQIRQKGYRIVFTVHGCFFGVSLSLWKKVGFFDESTFLYHEESIMADRLARNGLKIAYSPAFQVIHKHVYDVNYRDDRWNRESWEYYCREYLQKSEYFHILFGYSEKYQKLINRIVLGMQGK